MSRKTPVYAILALSSVVAIGAYAYTSGPSVTGGANPLRTFVLHAATTGATNEVKQQVFEVPPGQTLVLTDLAVGDGSNKQLGNKTECQTRIACILSNGSPLACDSIRFYGKGGVIRNTVRLGTGLALSSGSKVELAVNGMTAETCHWAITATGYLMRQ